MVDMDNGLANDHLKWSGRK